LEWRWNGLLTSNIFTSYGDGSNVQGIMGQDRVNLAGLIIENQTIGLATTESTSFSNDVVDGILGLAYNSITCVPGTLTPMDNLIQQKLIQSPLFSVWLGRSSEGGGGGEFCFFCLFVAALHHATPP